MNLSSTIRTVKSVVTANSPVLLVGTAITGVVTTGVLAATGGYKARGVIDQARADRDVAAGEGEAAPLSLQEKVSLTWLCYAAPAVTGVSTIASVVGVHTIHTKRHAALAGLYAVTSGKLDDLREKSEELLGSKKTQQLNDALGQSAVDKNPLENKEVIITGEGDELCFDEWSARYFLGSVPQIEKAFAEVNLQLVRDGDASLNDFYEKIGLPPNKMGNRFGWNGGQKIQPRFGSTTSPNGRAAVSFTFHKEPKDNLGSV